MDDNLEAVKAADIVVLAVKPQQMGEVLAGFKSVMSDRKLVISIAAGVTTARIERELGEGTRVMRVMPNTPALVGAGAAAWRKGRTRPMTIWRRRNRFSARSAFACAWRRSLSMR